MKRLITGLVLMVLGGMLYAQVGPTNKNVYGIAVKNKINAIATQSNSNLTAADSLRDGDFDVGAATDVVARSMLKDSLGLHNLRDPYIHVADYYVATWGDDSNDGSFTSPWATLRYAVQNISAGDTVYLRGGEYFVDEDAYWFENSDGTPNAYKCIFNYPDEKPVFNHVNSITVGSHNNGIFLFQCDYWHLKGIDINHVAEAVGAYDGRGFHLKECTNIIVENCVSHHNGGIGFYAGGGATDSISYINCDSYWNKDYNDDGGAADGITINTIANYGLMKGCRAWKNSDDGFDTFAANNLVVIDDCWSWGNGWSDSGEGNGFKLGQSSANGDIIRKITNCISSHNEKIGIKNNEISGLCELYNNSVYNNLSANWSFAGVNPDSAHIIKNNISYSGGVADAFGTNTIVANNSWNRTDITITDADFISLDTSQLYRKRKPDGSLPYIDFLKPVSNSPLVDGGIPIDGIAGIGSAVDIGSEETSSGKAIYELTAALTDGAPTDAEIDTATSTTPDLCAGWTFHIKDSNGSGLTYIVTSNGTNWQYAALTIAT